MKYVKLTRTVLMLGVLGLVAFPGLAKKHTQEINLGAAKYKPKNQNILKTAWSQGLKTGGSQKRYYPETSQPVTDGQNVYVGTTAGVFYAVDASTGRQLWRYQGSGPITSGAAVTEDLVVFADLDGRVIALNKSNGAKVWHRYFHNEINSAILYSGGRCYFLAGERTAMALDSGTGQTVWQRSLDIFTRDITMHGHGSFTTDGSHLFVGLADGHVYGLSPSDGGVQWEQSLNQPLQSFKDIDARVVVDGDGLYAVGYFGALYKLNHGGGKVWQADVASGAEPLISDGRVVVGDVDGVLQAFDTTRGNLLWANELNGSVLSAPAAFAGYLVVGAFENSLFVIDPQTGQQLQQISSGGGSINRPVVVGDRLIFLTNGGKLIALRKK